MALIIAEAGVNHNGNEDLAIQLIDAAHAAGADIVKFQTFRASKIVTKTARMAQYQRVNTGRSESQYEMLSRLELSVDSHHRLLAHSKKLGIGFLSTAFDSDSLNFLVEDIGLKKLKIPSGEITNAPLVLEHARTGCELIISTGMASLREIEDILGVIAFGYLADLHEEPSIEAFRNAYYSDQGKSVLKDKVTILHCTTEYPAPFEDINLFAMDTLSAAFGLRVGFSDHSEGIAVAIAAVARGAEVIEKHFTLDKTMEGPDHKASLNPEELEAMVHGIRSIELSFGDGIKGPRPSEFKNLNMARKSIVAGRNISEGEIIEYKDVEIKRPGGGMSPFSLWKIIGRPAKFSFKAGDLIVD
ncbi:N-acetylneuraminate synthase [Gammaproteobacteria bacterium]|nr:N-acetylneuraminate synthase [Gammaproteobacteria bacterium]